MEAKAITVREQFSELYRKIGCKSAGTREDLLALVKVARISDENARLRRLIASLLELIDKHTDLPVAASNGVHSHFSDPPRDVWFVDCGLHAAQNVMKRCRDVTDLPPGREAESYRVVDQRFYGDKPPASPALRTAPPHGDGEMGD